MKKIINADNITKIFHILALVLFCSFFYYSLGYTGEQQDLTSGEYINLKRNSILINVIIFSLTLFVLFLIGKLHDKFLYKLPRNLLLTLACLFSFAFSIYWVYACKSVPIADQGMIVQHAVAFNQGDFNGLKIGRYIARYSQQLGLVTFLRGLFYLFGESNYQAYQYFSTISAPLIIFSGCQILRKLTCNNRKIETYYLLLMVCCFPMYPYVAFVYGDLVSTALTMFATWIFLCCLDRFTVPRVLALGLAVGLAIQFRKNALVWVIALIIVVIVKMIQKPRLQYAVTGCSIILGILLLQSSLRLLYNDVWDDTAEAIPALPYIVMGLNDDNGNPGWHNAYEYHIFYVSDDIPAVANQLALEDLKMYTSLYKANPDYAADFFIRKMNYQWNVPMYQCQVMTYEYEGERDRFMSTIYNGGRLAVFIQDFMKAYQLTLYGSILFLLILTRKEKYPIENYVLLIATFGGFLFSMIWEAKTRYVFPYFIMMIPYYAIAIHAISARLDTKLAQIRNKEPKHKAK